MCEKKGKCVLALGSGSSALSTYACLIDLYNQKKVDFANVIVFNIAELFYPGDTEGVSTLARLKEVFLDKVNIKPENIHSFNNVSTTADVIKHARNMKLISKRAVV